jgi:hypothetical protein
MMSLLTVAPYTSAKCAATSPVVKPFAVNDNTISSMQDSRQLVGELQQQPQLVLALNLREVGHHIGQGCGH